MIRPFYRSTIIRVTAISAITMQSYYAFGGVNSTNDISSITGDRSFARRHQVSHAVHSEALGKTLQMLHSLAYKSIGNKELLVEIEAKNAELAKAADDLSKSVNEIIDSQVKNDLSASERSHFTTLAESLRAEALAVKEAANQASLQGIPAKVDKIEASCTSCHALFQKSPNISDECRDSRYTC